MKHNVIRSKMKKGYPLMTDPILSSHFPDTDWFQESSLRKMLRNHTAVYIKPDVGRKGNGVIRLKRLNRYEHEISHGETTIICPSKKLYSELTKMLNPKKNYLVQQGIDLATYRKRPFDVRVVLQKPLNTWRATLMSAKIAPNESSVVTNVAKGAKDLNVYKAINGIDQSVNRPEVLRDLLDVSHQIAQKLDSVFPLRILGLDMGIDKKGKVWFIEANTKPDNVGLENIDRKLYRKYRAAKKWMRKG
ncbi:YheC/YheD family protein [Cohnella kolymensis]|uniref:YheC/YheD family protein n=1 Tax=Cohnella kolymensis TaxID=1590652 RepID=UPI000A4F2E9D|nr:YheC/YheD family protein [Cohnella kolymensis]